VGLWDNNERLQTVRERVRNNSPDIRWLEVHGIISFHYNLYLKYDTDRLVSYKLSTPHSTYADLPDRRSQLHALSQIFLRLRVSFTQRKFLRTKSQQFVFDLYILVLSSLYYSYKTKLFFKTRNQQLSCHLLRATAVATKTPRPPKNSCPLFLNLFFESLKPIKKLSKIQYLLLYTLIPQKRRRRVLTPHDVGCSDT
jgi:hypothetical protein